MYSSDGRKRKEYAIAENNGALKNAMLAYAEN